MNQYYVYLKAGVTPQITVGLEARVQDGLLLIVDAQGKTIIAYNLDVVERFEVFPVDGKPEAKE